MATAHNTNEPGIEATDKNNLPPSRKTGFWNFIKTHPVLTTIVIAIIAIAAVYFGKDIQANQQKAAIENRASEQIQQKNIDMLKLMAKPLVWSIRAEMLRDNLEQVNIFTSDLVKEPHVQFIYLIAPDGKILISTDKKLEGQPIADRFESSLLQTDSIKVVQHKNKKGMLVLAAPVMGFDRELAVIILEYAAPGFVNSDAKTGALTGLKD